VTERKFYSTTTKEEMEMELGFHEFQGEKEREKTHKILQCRDLGKVPFSSYVFNLVKIFL